ncbi:MAG: hypothetical protein ONB44_24510 [candidate division KSB1 bacterium]|nr:hypothetical protein [candidate division KSB1 bacterium]MDZ7314408.1 hypothetical protein [candidate division KSB1 bacterium]
MGTRTRQYGLAAERIWGVEVMDPLQQHEWAQRLWQHLHAPLGPPRPLLLVYSPAAERSAIRSLITLARIARHHVPAVFISTPEGLPWLETDPTQWQGLHLIHHGSRFLNLAVWRKIVAELPACRVVITAPDDEYEFMPDHHDFDIVHVPEEEPEYCAHKAEEIIAAYFRAASPSPTPPDRMEEILFEAGTARVAVPLSLLARHLRRDRMTVMKTLQSSRLQAFIWCSEDEELVFFRGRWLVEKLASKDKRGHYPHLVMLLDDCDPAVPAERFFFLHFLVALRARGFPHQAARLQDFYHHLFYYACQFADAHERPAWDWVAHHGVLSFLRILFYLAEARVKALYYQLLSPGIGKIHYVRKQSIWKANDKKNLSNG